MFIGQLIHIQSVDLHLSHYMKFYDTVHGYNTIPANTGGAFPNMVENKTKYFRLRLDEVSSERPKRDLGETWVWPGTDLRLT